MSFDVLEGGQIREIATDGTRLATLNGNSATWWEDGVPVTAHLPGGMPVDGARWSDDGT